MSVPPDRLERFTTGIAGLDTITNGGFYRGGLYLVQGTPGTGKTTLANQISFHRANAGERVLYVTLLAEYHARMVQYLSRMSFFDATKLPDLMSYVSAFRVMRDEGLDGLLTFLRRELITKKLNVLVIDGLIAAQRVASSEQLFNEFVHEVQAIAISTDCTVFLIASADRHPHTTPEHTMVDGIVELSDQPFSWASERVMQLSKIRGTSYLRGKHSYTISDDGINVYPRIETLLLPRLSDGADLEGRLSTGSEPLDAMLGGGLPSGSPTMLIGPSGVGKTTFGLQFLAGSTESEPGLLYGFYETPARIIAKANDVCKPMVKLMHDGAIEVLWQPPAAGSLDAYGDRLLNAVRRRGIRRLFLDGLGALQKAPDGAERLGQFLPALTNELRALGVTSLYSYESGSLSGPVAPPAFDNLSLLTENLIVMRYFEKGARLHRFISILKVRNSEFDPMIHEFVLTDAGPRVSASSLSAAAVLGEGLTSGLPSSPAAD